MEKVSARLTIVRSYTYMNCEANFNSLQNKPHKCGVQNQMYYRCFRICLSLLNFILQMANLQLSDMYFLEIYC